MRTSQTIKNISVALILGVVVTLMNFISQRYFVKYLGTEYLGLNSVFVSIMGMLSLAELGLGSAITYHLYKPLHNNDKKQISSYVNFYKNGYRLIALSILLISALLAPFVPFFVGATSININIYFIFYLFVFNTLLTYLLSYKRSVLYADQKNYVINIVHFSTVLFITLIQILILIYTKNYYLFLGIKIIGTIIENIILNKIVDNRYSLSSTPEKLTPKIKKGIYKNIYGLLYHNLGSFVRRGIPTIIISTFLGLYAAGLYANYFLIKSTIDMLFLNITASIKASVGNLLVDKDAKGSFLVFKRLQFAGRFMVTLWVSFFLVASNAFITLWLGKNFVYPTLVVLLYSIYIYLDLSKWTGYTNFKEAAGIFYEDRYVALAQLVFNIGISLILVKPLGVAGVMIGSIVGALIPYFTAYPKYVYKNVLGRDYKEYIRVTITGVVTTWTIVGVTFFLSTFIEYDNLWINLLVKALIGIVTPFILLVIIYHKTAEFKYFINLLKNILKNRNNRLKRVRNER